jgi:hypothetical protein
MTDSWLDHMRLHQRLTNADSEVEQAVRRLQVDGEPKTTHLVLAQPHD